MTDDRVQDPWRWPEAIWRGIVRKVSAGHSLASAWRPGRARSAVTLSFDSDHEDDRTAQRRQLVRPHEPGPVWRRHPDRCRRVARRVDPRRCRLFQHGPRRILRPYTSPDAVLSIFAREFDVAYEEGGLFLLTMHPHHSGPSIAHLHPRRDHSYRQGEGRRLVRHPCRDGPLLRRTGGPARRLPQRLRNGSHHHVETGLRLDGLNAGACRPAGLGAGKDTLIVDLPNDAATLDPHVQWDTDSYTVYRNIFDNLVTRDTAGKIVPQIATAWRYRTTRRWSSTSARASRSTTAAPLTSEDVAFSISRIINPAFKSPQLSQFDQIVVRQAAGPKVVMKTKSPYPALIAQLVKLSIVPKAVVENVGDQEFNLEAGRQRPLQARDLAEGRAVERCVANEAYWARQAALQDRRIPGRARRRHARRRSSHRARRHRPAARSRRGDRAEEGARSFRYWRAPTERIGYMFVNAQAGPTADVRVRRAIAHSIDQKTLIDALLQGFGNPVNIVLTPANFGYVADVKGYPLRPRQGQGARQGSRARRAPTLSFLTSPAYDRRVVEALQQMVQEVGLKVEIVALDHPTFLRRRQGRPDEAGSLSLGRWSCACQDADGVIFPLFRTGSIWAKYSNPAFDKEVDAARSRARRGASAWTIYRKAFEILREDVPGIGLYQDFAIYGARKELQWQPTANEAFFVMDMKWVQ